MVMLARESSPWHGWGQDGSGQKSPYGCSGNEDWNKLHWGLQPSAGITLGTRAAMSSVCLCHNACSPQLSKEKQILGNSHL